MDEWMYSLALVVGVKEILETNNVIKNLSAEKIAFPSVMAQFPFIVRIIIVWRAKSIASFKNRHSVRTSEKNHKNEERVDLTMITTTTLERKIAMIHPQIFFTQMKMRGIFLNFCGFSLNFENIFYEFNFKNI